MRSPRSAAAALACAALATIAGCASAGPSGSPARSLSASPSGSPSGSPVSPAGTTGPACPAPVPNEPSASRKLAARLWARVLLCDFAVPPGARQLAKAPAVRGGTLTAGAAAGQPSTPDIIELDQWWLVPGKPTAVLAWESRHVPGDLKPSGSGTTSLGGLHLWSDVFSSASGPRWLNAQNLSVAVAADGKDTAVVVEAQVTWIPARTAGEKVPATARAVTISENLGFSHGKTEPPKPVTITAPVRVRKLVALVNSLPLFPPGTYSCPAGFGDAVTLKFRGAPGKPPLAVATDLLSGCARVLFTIGGKPRPDLAALSAKTVLQVVGLPWKVPSGPGSGLPARPWR